MESIIARKMQSFKLEIDKFFNKFFYLSVILLGLIFAFFLGRMTHFLESRPDFAFEYSNESVTPNMAANILSTSTIVASKTGKKYYFVWCKAVTNIKDSKRVYFDSEENAKKAGYTLANNCK